MRPMSFFWGLGLFLCLILQGCDARPDTHAEQRRIANAPLANQNAGASSGDARVLEREESIGERFTLVMLGDSITAGFGLPADEALPVKLEQALLEKGETTKIINAGVSGDTTADALARFNWSVGPQADGVLIALGGNDLLQGLDPASTKANLATIIENAKARDLSVFLAGMRAPGNYGREFQSAFDDLYPSLAKTYDIAFYPFLLDGVGAKTALNQPDGIHPNKKGVAVIVEGLSDFLAAEINN